VTSSGGGITAELGMMNGGLDLSELGKIHFVF
jgi:hypothetical protein